MDADTLIKSLLTIERALDVNDDILKASGSDTRAVKRLTELYRENRMNMRTVVNELIGGVKGERAFESNFTSPNYNAARYLAAQVESFLRNTRGLTFEGAPEAALESIAQEFTKYYQPTMDSHTKNEMVREYLGGKNRGQFSKKEKALLPKFLDAKFRKKFKQAVPSYNRTSAIRRLFKQGDMSDDEVKDFLNDLETTYRPLKEAEGYSPKKTEGEVTQNYQDLQNIKRIGAIRAQLENQTTAAKLEPQERDDLENELRTKTQELMAQAGLELGYAQRAYEEDKSPENTRNLRQAQREYNRDVENILGLVPSSLGEKVREDISYTDEEGRMLSRRELEERFPREKGVEYDPISEQFLQEAAQPDDESALSVNARIARDAMKASHSHLPLQEQDERRRIQMMLTNDRGLLDSYFNIFDTLYEQDPTGKLKHRDDFGNRRNTSFDNARRFIRAYEDHYRKVKGIPQSAPVPSEAYDYQEVRRRRGRGGTGQIIDSEGRETFERDRGNLSDISVDLETLMGEMETLVEPTMKNIGQYFNLKPNELLNIARQMATSSGRLGQLSNSQQAQFFANNLFNRLNRLRHRLDTKARRKEAADEPEFTEGTCKDCRSGLHRGAVHRPSDHFVMRGASQEELKNYIKYQLSGGEVYLPEPSRFLPGRRGAKSMGIVPLPGSAKTQDLTNRDLFFARKRKQDNVDRLRRHIETVQNNIEELGKRQVDKSFEFERNYGTLNIADDDDDETRELKELFRGYRRLQKLGEKLQGFRDIAPPPDTVDTGEYQEEDFDFGEGEEVGRRGAERTTNEQIMAMQEEFAELENKRKTIARHYNDERNTLKQLMSDLEMRQFDLSNFDLHHPDIQNMQQARTRLSDQDSKPVPTREVDWRTSGEEVDSDALKEDDIGQYSVEGRPCPGCLQAVTEGQIESSKMRTMRELDEETGEACPGCGSNIEHIKNEVSHQPQNAEEHTDDIDAAFDFHDEDYHEDDLDEDDMESLVHSLQPLSREREVGFTRMPIGKEKDLHAANIIDMNGVMTRGNHLDYIRDLQTLVDAAESEEPDIKQMADLKKQLKALTGRKSVQGGVKKLKNIIQDLWNEDTRPMTHPQPDSAGSFWPNEFFPINTAFSTALGEALPHANENASKQWRLHAQRALNGGLPNFKFIRFPRPGQKDPNTGLRMKPQVMEASADDEEEYLTEMFRHLMGHGYENADPYSNTITRQFGEKVIERPLFRGIKGRKAKELFQALQHEYQLRKHAPETWKARYNAQSQKREPSPHNMSGGVTKCPQCAGHGHVHPDLYMHDPEFTEGADEVMGRPDLESELERKHRGMLDNTHVFGSRDHGEGADGRVSMARSLAESEDKELSEDEIASAQLHEYPGLFHECDMCSGIGVCNTCEGIGEYGDSFLGKDSDKDIMESFYGKYTSDQVMREFERARLEETLGLTPLAPSIITHDDVDENLHRNIDEQNMSGSQGPADVLNLPPTPPKRYPEVPLNPPLPHAFRDDDDDEDDEDDEFDFEDYDFGPAYTEDELREQIMRRLERQQREEGHLPVMARTLPSPGEGYDTLADMAGTSEERDLVEEVDAEGKPTGRMVPEPFLTQEYMGVRDDKDMRSIYPHRDGGSYRMPLMNNWTPHEVAIPSGIISNAFGEKGKDLKETFRGSVLGTAPVGRSMVGSQRGQVGGRRGKRARDLGFRGSTISVFPEDAEERFIHRVGPNWGLDGREPNSHRDDYYLQLEQQKERDELKDRLEQISQSQRGDGQHHMSDPQHGNPIQKIFDWLTINHLDEEGNVTKIEGPQPYFHSELGVTPSQNTGMTLGKATSKDYKDKPNQVEYIWGTQSGSLPPLTAALADELLQAHNSDEKTTVKVPGPKGKPIEVTFQPKRQRLGVKRFIDAANNTLMEDITYEPNHVYFHWNTPNERGVTPAQENPPLYDRILMAIKQRHPDWNEGQSAAYLKHSQEQQFNLFLQPSTIPTSRSPDARQLRGEPIQSITTLDREQAVPTVDPSPQPEMGSDTLKSKPLRKSFYMLELRAFLNNCINFS
jgi:hypothetical protein